MLRIDAHHHLWAYKADEFAWLEGPLEGLRRDFAVADLEAAAAEAGVSGTVAVQARQSLEETDWLLEVAAATPLICGVVGWVPLCSSEFPAVLARYSGNPWLKGVRHVVQAEPDGFMDAPAFDAGIRALRGSGLVYDVLITERQLDEATRLVDRHPEQQFVLNHIAKPLIAAGEMDPWATRMRELARRSQVVCKVSGMVTEADPARWTERELRPYFEVVLEAFRPERLMAGTDWPVVLAGCTYPQWWDVLAGWAKGMSATEQAEFLGGTARRVYRLAV